MARRRSSSGAWTSKQYKSPLWKYVHPAKYLRSEYRKAKRAMHPVKVIGRVTSLDQVVNLGRTTTTKVNATTRQAEVQRAAQKKTAAKKTAKRPDPYAVALAIPAQNRAVGAQQARARTAQAKKAAPMSDRVLRGKGGKLAGSRPALNDDDQQLYRQAKQGYVDPVLLPRSPRRRAR
jgi:hypothetical protein